MAPEWEKKKPVSTAEPRLSSEQRFTPGGQADQGVVAGGMGKTASARKRGVGKSEMYFSSGAPAHDGAVVVGLPAAEGTSSSKDASKFKLAIKQPLSTFSADVDTASYSNVRREIQNGQLPQVDSVRVEEMVNYFNYDLPEPNNGEPFSVTTELSTCPWSAETELLRVAIKTKSLDRGEAPPRNLVFLLDVSGSMNSGDKLPLLKKSLRQFVDTLDDSDRVAIVVYAGASGLVLPSTSGDQKLVILDAIERLSAGGSTNGAAGIQLAYDVAQQNMSKNSVNRVILATDGDFNVGLSSQSELKSLIEQKRESGLFLSVLGFGRGGNDKVMETLADNGNGNYASIDTLSEARKVLIKEAGATLVTVAKDVKFQVAFEPKEVKNYRLIGYKNRRLANRDFDDDTKDAGDLGAGHEVTALYEITRNTNGIDESLMSSTGLTTAAKIATVKLRYKAPDSEQSELIEVPVQTQTEELVETSADQQWACAVAGYGMLLEKELTTQQLPFSTITTLLKPVMAGEPDAYQAEFYSLLKKSEEMMGS